MENLKKKALAQLPGREWVELEVSLSEEGMVLNASWKAKGCHRLLTEADKLSVELKGKSLKQFYEKNSWGKTHTQLLLKEALQKITGQFIEVADEEICHCRKINQSTIDQMIVLGAHTPEKVKAWTSAGSGCGTCRPEVEKLIARRIGD